MMESTRAECVLIKGGRIVDPARGIDEVGDVWLGGSVVATSAAGRDPRVFDARGLIVAPGLVDIHVHLREPGGEHKETIATGTAAAAAGGFTTVACMPNTRPALDTPERIAWVRERADACGRCRVLPIAAVTRGREGRAVVDVAALYRAGAVAFSDDGDGVMDDAVMAAALEQVRAAGAVLIQHCEDRRRSAGGVMHAGGAARELGLPGHDPAAEEGMLERDLALVRRTGARYHAAHLSTARSVDLVRAAKAEGLPVTAEVTPHHLTLCDDDVLKSAADPNFKMNPPLRSARDREACRAALLDGTIDCVATDHAPHTAAEKGAGFGAAPFGVVGLETALGVVQRVMSASGAADWSLLIERMSVAPARIVGRPVPVLAPGQPADLTLIDPVARWTVDPAGLTSKSCNTPFAGWELIGRAVATIVGGRWVHLRAAEQARWA